MHSKTLLKSIQKSKALANVFCVVFRAFVERKILYAILPAVATSARL